MQLNLFNHIKNISATQYATGALVAVMGLVIITPLCGFIFSCGCTWPWAGLEAHCNIHDAAAEHQCPWCTSYFAGGLSTFLSIGAGCLTAIILSQTKNLEQVNYLTGKLFVSKIIGGTSAGMLAFLVVAFITGWLAAMAQGNPSFLLN